MIEQPSVRLAPAGELPSTVMQSTVDERTATSLRVASMPPDEPDEKVSLTREELSTESELFQTVTLRSSLPALLPNRSRSRATW